MEYSDLASFFPSLYRETPIGALPSFLEMPSKYKIPRILHYIWLGDKPLPDEFLQNISYFSSRMQNLEGITIIWTDRPRDLMGVQVVDVESVFGNRKAMTMFYHYRASLAKIPPNYGEAGDLLRYEIINRFGGYYFDCDIHEKEIDLGLLLAKGEDSPQGFVCGYCSIGSFCRNDIFGAAPNNLVMNCYRDLVLSNYRNKVWNRRVTYSRPFLWDFTILTTGPDAFKESVDSAIDEESREGTFVLSAKDYSALSWVYDHTTLKPISFPNDQERRDRIKHDLMLNLIYKEKILDLEKYQQEGKWLISVVEELMTEHPKLVASVDRIFIGDVDTYCKLKNVFQKRIHWNEPAVLKFACIMKKNDLIRFLIGERGVNLSVCEDVGYYENFT